MRGRLIVNPSSGTGRGAELLPLMATRLRTLVADLDISLTTGEPDVIRAATRAVDEGCDLLFIAGGDGTINVAVRTIAAIDGALERVAFAVIPAGTGNDFAKALGLGETPEPAIERLLETQSIAVDLGFLNDRAFVNVSAGGFVADVSTVLSEPLKDATGKLAFIIGGARVLLGREPFSADVRLPAAAAGLPSTELAAPFPGPIALQMFAVCNAPLIGGGYPIAPSASIDDGLLDVFLVRRTTTLDFLVVLQKIAAGEHRGDDRILHFRSSELQLVLDRTIHVNTDGEVLEADDCVYRVKARAARFLCGPEPRADASPRPLVV